MGRSKAGLGSGPQGPRFDEIVDARQALFSPQEGLLEALQQPADHLPLSDVADLQEAIGGVAIGQAKKQLVAVPATFIRGRCNRQASKGRKIVGDSGAVAEAKRIPGLVPDVLYR